MNWNCPHFDQCSSAEHCIARQRSEMATAGMQNALGNTQLERAQAAVMLDVRAPLLADIANLRAEIERLQAKIADDALTIGAQKDTIARLCADKDHAYRERNQLVAALSKVFPAHLMQHEDDPSWDADWRTIVCIELPTGQATWHVHDSDKPLFVHLEERPNDWDGHDTEEKYRRLASVPVLARHPSDVLYHEALRLKRLLAWFEAYVDEALELIDVRDLDRLYDWMRTNPKPEGGE